MMAINYTAPHYTDHPCVLARLNELSDEALRDRSKPDGGSSGPHAAPRSVESNSRYGREPLGGATLPPAVPPDGAVAPGGVMWTSAR